MNSETHASSYSCIYNLTCTSIKYNLFVTSCSLSFILPILVSPLQIKIKKWVLSNLMCNHWKYNLRFIFIYVRNSAFALCSRRVRWWPLMTVWFSKDFHASRSISLVKLTSSLPFCIATCGILPSLRILKLPISISINHVNSKFNRVNLDRYSICKLYTPREVL